MSAERTRERIVDLVRRLRENTTDRGCTPAEAAAFAAKAAAWIERYQIEEAEVRAAGGGPQAAEAEVCQERVGTGKRVHNPGVTAVYAGLAAGMACQLVLFHERGEATYGVIGDRGDAAYVVQVAAAVLPLLEKMATAEGREHGEEKAGLVRWRNQYLAGAGGEIRRRLLAERAERSRAREEDARKDAPAGQACRALAVVTGETLAAAKLAAAGAYIEKVHGRTRRVTSRARYDGTARDRGTAAGRSVGLRIGLDAREGGGR